jgi:hypothetical protein
MNRTAIVIAIGLALAATLPAAPTKAANARSFVSSTGSDSNNCALAAPCRTFAVAFTNTTPGGEIDVLNTAGYGPLTITNAISIVNDGSVASVAVPSGGVGITINAGVNDAVSLRGLTIEGAGVGEIGIKFNTGQSLTVENCVIRHLTNAGIALFSNASSNLFVSNTLVADNVTTGIQISPTGTGTVTAVFNRVEVNNNSSGAGIEITGQFSTGGSITATVSESVASGNNTGLQVSSTSGEPVTNVTVFHSVLANNQSGIATNGANATVSLAQSVVTGNTGNGWNISSGVIQTYQDNYFNDNGTNVGSLTNIGKQ